MTTKAELTLEEIKQIELDILKRFDVLCAENAIEYSLAYGTMLGAVRHKGFIPWDDDIDVFVSRDDYEKLLALRFSDGRYEIKSHRYTKDYFYPFAKMVDTGTALSEPWRNDKNMGLYIDIFPIDYLDFNGENEKAAVLKKIDKKSLSAYLMGHKLSHHKEFSVRYLTKFLFLFFTYPFKKAIINNFDNYCSGFSSGSYCGMLLQSFSERNIVKADFDRSIIKMQFEDFEAPVYADYDYLLTVEYGDYMMLPPEEERVSNHYFEVYVK